MDLHDFIYPALFFIAGFIDSIAGGGGLITVPVFTLILGPGAIAIGTNKIVGAAAAGMAFIVYAKKGHFSLQAGLHFTVSIFIGSFIGSWVGGLLPTELFKWLMIGVLPAILFLVLKKNQFVERVAVSGLAVVNNDDGVNAKFSNGWLAQNGQKANSAHGTDSVLNRQTFHLLFAGVICGFYDGVLGPGGGTIMLLSLLIYAKMPLLKAIGISKFANLASALAALSGYALQSQVKWQTGSFFAVFAIAGALIGAQITTKKAAKIVRPILVVIVIFLFIKLVSDLV